MLHILESIRIPPTPLKFEPKTAPKNAEGGRFPVVTQSQEPPSQDDDDGWGVVVVVVDG